MLAFQPETRFRIISVMMAGAMAGAMCLLLYDTPRTSIEVLTLLGLSFSSYTILLQQRLRFNSFWLLTGLAIGLRLAMITAPPRLSDDYFRFVWDGRLQAEGISPYAHLPKDIKSTPLAQQIDPTAAVFTGLNSANYFSVYPPLNQVMFRAAAFLSRGELQANIIWLRVLIWLGELVTVFFLMRLLRVSGKDERLWLLYALNPLVLSELTGNLHFEGWMAAFVLGAFYFFQKQKYTAAGLMLAGGALVKLLPLIFIPMLWARLAWWQRLWFSAAGLAMATVFCIPFFSLELVKNFASSVDLYFRSFEFNACVYYFLRGVGTWVKGYNPIAFIGPLTGILSLLMVTVFSFSKKFRAMPVPFMAVLILTGYFLLSTTVHPWYVVTLVPLAVVAGVRWPMVWSCVVILSYSHYFDGRFQENYWLIMLEYVILGVSMAWEWHTRNTNRIFTSSHSPSHRA